MNINILNHHKIYLLGISLLVLSGFIPEKHVPGFKEEKKGIDTLTIFNPVVQVFADNNRTRNIETELTQIDTRLIDSLTNKLLAKKYVLEKIMTPTSEIEVFSELFEQLENSPRSLVNVSSKLIFDNQTNFCKSKYALLLLYNGQFHPDFPPHYKLNSAVLSSTIVITPNNPTRSISDLRVLIIDTEKEQIVYYDRLNTSKYDARVQSEVVQMTKDLLKNIYYK